MTTEHNSLHGATLHRIPRKLPTLTKFGPGYAVLSHTISHHFNQAAPSLFLALHASGDTADEDDRPNGQENS